MKFQKGQSGNPSGRKKGQKNKATYLAEVLSRHGIEAGELGLATYKKAMADETLDLPTAARIAIEFMRLTYTPPTEQIEVTDTRVRTLADYFAAQPKDDTGEVKNESDRS